MLCVYVLVTDSMNAIQTLESAAVSAASNTQSSSPLYLDKEEVAKLFSVTVRTIDQWRGKGLLPYYKIGGLVRFRLLDVQAHLDATCRRVA